MTGRVLKFLQIAPPRDMGALPWFALIMLKWIGVTFVALSSGHVGHIKCPWVWVSGWILSILPTPGDWRQSAKPNFAKTYFTVFSKLKSGECSKGLEDRVLGCSQWLKDLCKTLPRYWRLTVMSRQLFALCVFTSFHYPPTSTNLSTKLLSFIYLHIEEDKYSF